LQASTKVTAVITASLMIVKLMIVKMIVVNVIIANRGYRQKKIGPPV
jgi:hypothetical protein